MEEGTERLILTRRWFGKSSIRFLFFTLLWASMMACVLTGAMKPHRNAGPLSDVFHIVTGLVLIYCTLASCLNSTVIETSKSGLRVKHGPLPWRGNKSITGTIRQLYCVEETRSTRRRSSPIYRVELIATGRRRETLIGDLTQPEEAWFIEQQLERYLGIVDRPVEGEYGNPPPQPA